MSRFQDFVEACEQERPSVFIVLGSGMAPLIDAVERVAEMGLHDIPGVPRSTVHGHHGILSLGRWMERAVIVSRGRLHYYEGNPWELVTRPIEVISALGVKTAILTNAAGGIRDDLEPGSLMPIRDHLEWNRPNPWREPQQPTPYSKRLLEVIRSVGGTAEAGVYASVTGPSYETPAEIRALRSCGADAVGMSTTREALAGVRHGIEVVAISLITNKAAGLSNATINHDEVIAVGADATERLGGVIEGVLKHLD